ncbi:hypothetical protein BC628DRAFT_1372643 [Trametes gibbosa]|nr:hypothetical protein BC628DRAFT_1372643 [Trametes gibbosa]
MSTKNLTKKQLESIIDDLRREVEGLTLERTTIQSELQATQASNQEQAGALTTLCAELEAAQQQAALAQQAVADAQAQAVAAEQARAALAMQLNVASAPAAHSGARAGDGAPTALVDIPRPQGTGWSIREAMEMDAPDYAEVQRTIRSLVIRSQLDWTEDFRRQDADKLSTLFRAARKAHPVLRRYVNNWATAAIARQYMQNKRKHAYKQGYIKKRSNPADGGHHGRRDDADGGAAAAPTCG